MGAPAHLDFSALQRHPTGIFKAVAHGPLAHPLSMKKGYTVGGSAGRGRFTVVPLRPQMQSEPDAPWAPLMVAPGLCRKHAQQIPLAALGVTGRSDSLFRSS